jgi:uncharacterized membrane protein YeiH
VDTASPLFLVLDLTGVFAFALNGALTAIRVARLDVVGVITLGMITALGGGIIRDILLDDLPPATFSDWRYLTVAATGAGVAYFFGSGLGRLATPIVVLDAAGLSLFAVSGALKALALGAGLGQAVILGVVTAVGGGTVRDMMIGRIPVVLRNELYAVPALTGALLLVGATELGAEGVPAATVGAVVCFAIRMVGVRYGLDAPGPVDLDPLRRARGQGGQDQDPPDGGRVEG